MKKVLWLAGLFAALSIEGFAYNVYAPNSFDEVKQTSWDYRTVYSLTEKGRAPSYTKSFFSRGHITRYELASVIKDILQNDHGEEDRDVLLKLKKEYVRELEALGYKEKRKGAGGNRDLTFTGDGRVKTDSKGNTDGRIRIGTTLYLDRKDKE